jgi:hypothetical protein
MKRLILLFALMIPLVVSAQTTSYGNFKVDTQELIYQKIFTLDGVAVDSLVKFYSKLPYISNVTPEADGLTFDLNDVVVDYKKFGFSQVATPPVIQTGKYSGKVTVGVKDGRYRVTVRSIVFTGDVGYKKVTEKDKLTNYATRNNGTVISADWCKPNTLALLDKAFTDKLEFVVAEKKKDKDDW